MARPEELPSELDNRLREKLSPEGNHVVAYCSVGYEAMINEEYDIAILAFKKSLELDPTYVPAYQFMGIAYADSGRNEEAIQCFKKCVESGLQGIDPEIEEENPFFHMAWCYEQLGQDEEAANSYRKSLETVPAHGRSFFRLARLYHRRHQYSEATRVYQAGIAACGGAAEPVPSSPLDADERRLAERMRRVVQKGTQILVEQMERNLRRAVNRQSFEDGQIDEERKG